MLKIFPQTAATRLSSTHTILFSMRRSTKKMKKMTSSPSKASAGLNRLRSESLRAVVLADETTVRWSEEDFPDDIACVRSSQPIPRDVTHFVFETEILSGDDVSVGFGNFNTVGKMNSDDGYSYSGKTGLVKASSEITQKLVPFEAGDVVTCGVSFLGMFVEPFVFFALNGEILNSILPWNGSKWTEFHAFVCSATPGSSVKIRFDESIQTKWSDTLKMIDISRNRRKLSDVKANFDDICERVVKDFLLHHGYVEALRAMDNEQDEDAEDVIDEKKTNNASSMMVKNGHTNSNNNRNGNGNGKNHGNGLNMKNHEEDDEDEMIIEGRTPKTSPIIKPVSSRKRSIEEMDVQVDADLQFARERRKIRGLVLEGRPIEAMKVVGEKWPDVLKTPIGLDLRIQCLVEFIVEGKKIEAVQFARRELWPYLKSEDVQDSNRDAAAIVKKAMGLFSLPDLANLEGKVRLQHLDKKRIVADALNRALLFHPNPPKSPALERILDKIAESITGTREKAGGYGGNADLRDLLPHL